jgi:hypothetical protein
VGETKRHPPFLTFLMEQWRMLIGNSVINFHPVEVRHAPGVEHTNDKDGFFPDINVKT